MKVVFRTDASLLMGSGHVMRCLTLATALKARGAQCHFISRAHPGHLLETIRQRGFKVNSLESPVDTAKEAIFLVADKSLDFQQASDHTACLGSTWQADAQDSAEILSELKPDWLVVDHYALDRRWEEALSPYCQHLMVIDDLADRAHQCDLLLDQNLGRQPQDYAGLVPDKCQLLTGPSYALLRPEFTAWREASLKRRAAAQGKPMAQLLIAMGGVDLPNATGQVLEALKACALPLACRITVVMGSGAPALEPVRALARQMPWPTTVLVDTTNMAQHMASSDLAIGAAGSTSWERCCLGLPALVLVLADNQQAGAQALAAAQAAYLMGSASHISEQLPLAILALSNSKHRMVMSHAASAMTDGCGVDKVLRALGAFNA